MAGVSGLLVVLTGGKKMSVMAGSNYCFICGKKIPKGQTVCDSCNRGDDD